MTFQPKAFITSLFFSGYNPINTTLYILVLFFSLLLILRVLERLKFRIDEMFAFSVITFVPFGSCLRVLEDAKVLSYFFLVSPFIYFLVFAVYFSLLLFFFAITRNHFKSLAFLALSGAIISSMVIGTLQFINLHFMQRVLGFVSVLFVFLFLVPISIDKKLVLAAQGFDATTTVLATLVGYKEIHPIPSFLFKTFTPWMFIPLKLIITFLVLVLLDKFISSQNERNLWKLVLGVLGMATGLRDFFRVSMMV